MPDAAASPLHIVKLCVGAQGPEDLRAWQEARRLSTGRPPAHTTRMRPRRADEVLDGGSLYWVFQGMILARQRIIALEETTREDGVQACNIVLDPEIIRTEPSPRRPFQGWRYLKPGDAPADLAEGGKGAEDAPAELLAALSDLGVVA
ncbi:DUF1489 family protein [Rhodovulum sp. DZ06]|uniref:DUF1489 family protein n=1 Tax=Rhodovulum sp. DZ06 TaxID=3425126 RepID=UPI003D33FEB7